MKKAQFFSTLTFLLTVSLTALGNAPPIGGMGTFLFIDFEASSGWRPGPLPETQFAIQLLQGDAEVAQIPGTEEGQALRLGAANDTTVAFVDASPIAQHALVYAEILVRPVAIDEKTDLEFLDFAGALVAFFRSGDRAEICVLSSRTEEESVWIASENNFPLDDLGQSREWIRIGMIINRDSGR